MRLSLSVWHRKRFAVHLEPDATMALPERAELVSGIVSGPFGIYPGTAYRAGHAHGSRLFTLLHMPSQYPKLTLPQRGLCQEAAEEFADCDLAWESAYALGVIGTAGELERAAAITRWWKQWRA